MVKGASTPLTLDLLGPEAPRPLQHSTLRRFALVRSAHNDKVRPARPKPVRRASFGVKASHGRHARRSQTLGRR